jgi:exo-beta-1,3-glucanase (GH17 family)
MRGIVILAISVSAAFLFVNSAGKPLAEASYRGYGICFSPYLELDPNKGHSVPAERISSLLDIVSPYFKWIRTYGATHGQENVPRIAKAKGLSVAAGCWLSRDRTANEAEISSLLRLIQNGHVDLAIVGSEVLLRNDLSEDELIGYIRRVKASGVPVTTGETWSELLQHPKVMAECSVILAHFYPYWEGMRIDQALKNLHQNYLKLKQAAGGKEVIVGETGWPSGGCSFGQAVASPENASLYFLNFVSWARAENVKYFYFEAFDEVWKASYEGPQGAYWGIWDKTFQMKPGMIRVFNGETMPNNWSSETPKTIPGDLDFDGRITVLDATLSLRFLLGLDSPSPKQVSAADINRNGKLDIGDCIMILRLAVGLAA